MNNQKKIDIIRVIFEYENETRLVIEGEQAREFGKWFFRDKKLFGNFDWAIKRGKAENRIKGFFGKITSWTPWNKTRQK